MRKILAVAALAAASTMAVLSGAGSANAAVTYNATHDGVITGHVDKSDVQSALGWNEAQVQSTSVVFSSTFASVQDNQYSCSDGTVDHGIQTLTFKMGITADEVRGGAGQKIKGWDLTGMGALSDMVVTKTGPKGFGDACTGHGYTTGYRVAQDHVVGDTLKIEAGTPLAAAKAAKR